MSDRGSSVTLILYSLDPGWMTGSEPFLNLVAAAAQRSTFTHVELAIVRCLTHQTLQQHIHDQCSSAARLIARSFVTQGEGAGAHGEMVNVLRVFNDSTGVVN